MSSKGFTNGSGGNVGENILSSLGGIVSTKPTAKFTSGARTTLKINNKIVGFAFNVSWTINTEVMENRTIDDYLPVELIPNKITVSGSIGAFHIPGQGASASLIQADVLGFLFHKYITIEVRDTTDNLLFYTDKAIITSRTETLQSEQLGTTQLNFMAIGWKDERDPAPPEGIDTVSDSSSEKSAGSRLLDKLSSLGPIAKKFIAPLS